ncbi:MAG TPA: FecR domain-containing protein [Ferrovibrio sp.]|uniref:FecR domain-containing protein n=1 Tax=Ferrovibrio sp. TaxID=1917215 RepID=UPI002ED6997D
MAASLYRRALRASLTLAVAAIAGYAAQSWAAPDHPGMAPEDVMPAAATTAPKIVGQELQGGRPVVLGSRIASGPGSGMKFLLNDRTALIIGPNSSLRVDEFEADRVVLQIERGSFQLDSANPGNVYVVLPTATVAVKAATVAGRIGPDATEVALLSVGRAEVTGFGGQVVHLEQAGQMTRIVGLGAPSRPASLSPQQLRGFIGLPSQLAALY